LRCGGFGSGATPPGTAKHWEKYGYDQWIGSRENCTGNPIFNGKKTWGFWLRFSHQSNGNPGTLVNAKIVAKWMNIPSNMV
jgi:hypothetical protein